MSLQTTRPDPVTGRPLTVGTADDMGVAPDGGGWVTLCEDHSTLINSDTRRDALLTTAFEFCDGCRWLYTDQTFGEYTSGVLERDYGPRTATPLMTN